MLGHCNRVQALRPNSPNAVPPTNPWSLKLSLEDSLNLSSIDLKDGVDMCRHWGIWPVQPPNLYWTDVTHVAGQGAWSPANTGIFPPIHFSGVLHKRWLVFDFQFVATSVSSCDSNGAESHLSSFWSWLLHRWSGHRPSCSGHGNTEWHWHSELVTEDHFVYHLGTLLHFDVCGAVRMFQSLTSNSRVNASLSRTALCAGTCLLLATLCQGKAGSQPSLLHTGQSGECEKALRMLIEI